MKLPLALVVAAACLLARPARAEGLVLTPPDLAEPAAEGGGSPAFASRLELGRSVGELAGDLVLRSAFLGVALTILCISSCASAVSPWQGTLAVLLVTPLVDAVLVWGIGLGSDTFEPRLLWTLAGSYGGAIVEGLLVLAGVLSGNWGLTIGLGLVGCALAAAGTTYVQLVTKVPVVPSSAATASSPLATVLAF